MVSGMALLEQHNALSDTKSGSSALATVTTVALAEPTPIGEFLLGAAAIGFVGYNLYQTLTAPEGIVSIGEPTAVFSLGGEQAVFPDAGELSRRLGIPRTKLHDRVKELKDSFPVAKRKIGAKNPDIGISKDGTIVLKNRKTGKTIDTGVPVDAFKD